jgi:CBS domain-containing protein
VCDSNNSIVGIVTDRDIILRGVACSKDPKSTPVTDIMTTNVCTCTPDEEIANAESKMSNNQVRRIPVVDNGKVVGILTLSNLTNNDDIIGKEQAYRTIEKICNCDKNNNAE